MCQYDVLKERKKTIKFIQLTVFHTLPPLSILSCTFFRKSLSLHLFESRIVVAYVDSEMRMSGRHLSIHAALQHKYEEEAVYVGVESRIK